MRQEITRKQLLGLASIVLAEAESKVGPIEVVQHRRQPRTGMADLHNKVIYTNPPSTLGNLYVYFHEVGHLVAHGKSEKSFMMEYKANLFAEQCWKRFGLPECSMIPHGRGKGQWLNHVDYNRRYVAYCLAKALNRGLKLIPEEVWQYCGKYLRKSAYSVLEHRNGIDTRMNKIHWTVDWRKRASVSETPELGIL